MSMKACVRTAPGEFTFKTVDVPKPGPGEALVKVTLTTVCGSDIHVMEMPPLTGTGEVVNGHEVVGVVEELGDGVEGFSKGDRVIASCITPCGTCPNCQRGELSSCLGLQLGKKGGFLYGLFADGAQAEYMVIPHANINLAKIPAALTDKDVLFAGDIMSTGVGTIERSGLAPGDTVAIFAQGPLGLCATAAAKMRGAGRIITVEGVPERVAMSKRMGADVVLDPNEDVIHPIMDLTDGVGVDVAVEALGREQTLGNCFRVTRMAGTIASLGVYGGYEQLNIPMTPQFLHRNFVTTFCPSGSTRLRQMMNLIEFKKMDLTPLWTHDMKLDDIMAGYDMFRNRKDGCIKIAITP